MSSGLRAAIIAALLAFAPAVVDAQAYVGGVFLPHVALGATDLNNFHTDLNTLIATKISSNQTITLSGDCSGSGATAVAATCTTLNGVSPGVFFHGTNAASLTGTLPAAVLPLPTASTLGGVESFATVSHQFINTISTSGVPSAAQPACADLSDAGVFCNGTSAASLTGNLSTSRLNSGTGASSTTFWRGDSTWATPAGGGTVSTTGTPASGNLAKFSASTTITNGDLSGDCTTAGTLAITCTKTGGVAFAASATTDTTSASNISAGTLAAARGGAGAITGALKGSGAGVVSQAACADLSNGATGCSTATGTSGATLPLLNAANTWSGVQSFNSGDHVLKGATSGTLTVNAAATAGANTLTLPAGTTDFSATGGASQVVKQTSAGGALTVAQLACADLSNATLCATSLTNGVTLGNVAQIGANTVLGNATAGAANIAAQAMPSCSAATNGLIWTTSTGFGCNSAINAATLGGATFAAPGTIGGGTPAAATHTTLTLTSTLTTNVTGGGVQCLQASNTGVVSGTAAGCGGAGSTGANPSASVGLSAVNGAATTFLRSDGAPALSQAISPTWTGLHQFSPTAVAAPTAQTWAAQGVVTGTTNTAGALWKLSDSGGTGTGTSGGFEFDVHPAGSTGSTPNAAISALAITTGGCLQWLGQQIDNVLCFGASPSASASVNTTAINAAIADGQTNNRRVYIPSAGTTGYSVTAGSLSITGNVDIFGDPGTGGNWVATNVDIPAGTPPLVGSVLNCTSTNNANCLSITGAAKQVGLHNIGFNFGTGYTATGDCINYTSASSGVGPMTSVWENVSCYGTDNNHYAFDIVNPQYIDLTNNRAYGGGALKLVGNNASFNTGNVAIVDNYFDMFLGNGTANCIDISGTGAQKMNLISSIRMQCNVENMSGVTPIGQVPTTSNFIYHQDANSQYITNAGLDIETNVNAPALLGAGTGNDYSLQTMFYDGGSGVLQMQPWGSNGLLDAVPSQTFQDVGSSGTIAEKSFMHLQAHHFSSTSATTASIMTTLWVDAPIAGTNLTPTRTEAAVFNGEVYAKGADFTSDAGIFNNAGNVQLGSVYATCSGYLTTTNGSGLVGCIVANTVSSVSGTGLGTTPSVTSTADGRDMVMDITVGTSPAAANFTITFGTAAAHGWRCDGDDITTNSTSVSQLKQFGTGSTTTCTMEMFSDVAVAAAMTAADHLRVRASPY